jgi:hypothetical protein
VSGKDFFYKGVNKVKVVTESEGYWIVEALEDFVDYLDGQRVTVKVGERRMVPPETLTNEMVLLPPVKEHVYERKMERKLMQIVEDAEERQKQTGNP